uniref:Putative cnidarian restricted protein n=1 Tax=Clytia hemisphaerica TaxID=252671 RepID=A0A069DUI0_9CNID
MANATTTPTHFENEDGSLSPNIISDKISQIMEQDRRNNNTNDTNEKTYKYHSQGCIYNNRQITVLKQYEDKNTIPHWLMPTTKVQ